MNLNEVAANGPAIAPLSRLCSAKPANRLLMLISRRVSFGALTALLVAIMLVSPASAQTTAPVQTAWRLLDYVAVDYPEAVKGGQIASPTEFAEMTEFSASARERIGIWMGVLIAYGVIIRWALRRGFEGQTRFTRLTAAGLAFTLSLYVGINVAMVMGLAPVVGIPLPLLSYGGSAMMTVLTLLGILMAIHRQEADGRRSDQSQFS